MSPEAFAPMVRDAKAGDLLAASTLPHTEARALLAHVLAASREHLIAHPEQPVDPARVARFKELAARRGAGEPLAYLLGAREFYGRRFEVSNAVLIPRPETELLVDIALACLATAAAPRVLELGTGSGCIAISLALERPDAAVVAVDLCAAALSVARRNAIALGAQVHWTQSDWYSELGERAAFDLIVSNPPYVAAGDPHLVALAHEPREALTDHADGLSCIGTLVAGAAAHLAPGGWIALEHGHDQAAAVRAMLTGAGLSATASHRDAAGIERVSLARRWA